MKIKLLFVCLGNICRSPMGEGAMLHLLKSNGLASKVFCDSAGTSAYHIGNSPDGRMISTARAHGVELVSKARQVQVDDFYEFDYIIAMDRANFQDLESIMPEDATGVLVMMRDYDPDPQDGDVPDPYYGGQEGFEEVFDICMRSCENLMKDIKHEF